MWQPTPFSPTVCSCLIASNVKHFDLHFMYKKSCYLNKVLLNIVLLLRTLRTSILLLCIMLHVLTLIFFYSIVFILLLYLLIIHCSLFFLLMIFIFLAVPLISPIVGLIKEYLILETEKVRLQTFFVVEDFLYFNILSSETYISEKG